MKSHALLGLGAGLLLLASGCSGQEVKPKNPPKQGEKPMEKQAEPTSHDAPAEGTCPMGYSSEATKTVEDWWPNQLDLRVLHQNAPMANPLGADFDYAEAYKTLDMAALKRDIAALLTSSQDWWPADYGHYGGLFIRLAWHSSGTYRELDGRGGSADGTIRFAPLSSWPDNGNLDKARRLLWPIKQKYGNAISWADLMVLTGNVSLESMGFKTLGFAGGREDVWEPQRDIDWGPEHAMLDDARHTGDRELKRPLGATEMGLIYVNPQGPHGVPDPLAAARDIRTAFGRMAMNDEETVALIAGGHTLGKAHGAADPSKHVGAEPEAAGVERQGLGWSNSYRSGKAGDTITSGLEGAWTSTPAYWSHDFFSNLFNYEWALIKGPGGAWQWTPKDESAQGTVPDAHDADLAHAPMMLTTDLALKLDPVYGPISKRFFENPAEFEAAFARAWYKLTHRDMGPYARLLGAEVPEPQAWQDPVPAVNHALIGEQDVTTLKASILDSGLTVQQLVSTAWASAATYRGTDMRGGANGARIRLAPQKDWAVNRPAKLAEVVGKLESIQQAFNAAQSGGKRVSLADVIVLGGNAAVEHAAKQAGAEVSVPFTPGRTDATQAMTDVRSFSALEPAADGFRNFQAEGSTRPAPVALVDQASKLTLTAPEMTVLVGGLRALGATNSQHGVFTQRPGVLSNDFFVNLLSMDAEWAKAGDHYAAHHRKTGKVVWTATSVDLLFGSNAQLRAISEVYASKGGQAAFVGDFVAAWTKVMNLDRFDLK